MAFEEIRLRTSQNLDRVENLIRLYENDLPGEGQGRRPQNSTDVLRSAVVFLHSALEDFLRSLERHHLPQVITQDQLKRIPLAGSGLNASKFLLDALYPFREKSVAEVINESISDHLDRSSYNSKDDITQSILRLGLTPGSLSVSYDTLDELAKRRHHIVHQADRNESTGKGHHKTRSLSLATTKKWRTEVQKLVSQVMEDLEAEG